MKGLNVKKLVAIGVGAALVGSALAPIASAIELTKDNVVNSSGQPVVDIVVGQNAAASDVVWAGNIAAKVAQLATIESSVDVEGGTAADAIVSGVDLIVGGVTKASTGATESTVNMDSTSSTKEFVSQLGTTPFANFKNTSYNIKIGGVTTSTTVTETVGIKADAAFNTSSAIKDLIATIAGGDINYVVTFSPGIDVMTDVNDATNAPISFLGAPWLVDTVTSSKVILVKSNAESTYAVGDTVPATGVNGKEYTYSIVSGGTASGGTYSATIELTDSNGTSLGKKTVNSGSNIEDSFVDSAGNPLISTKINIRTITKTSTSPDVYIFGLIVGSQKLELQTSGRFPYDAAKTSETPAWQVTLGYTSTKLTSIKLSNSAKLWDSSKPLYSKEYSLKTEGVALEAGVLEGSDVGTIGKIKFNGFDESGVIKSTVKFLKGSGVADVTGVTSYGAIQYTDTEQYVHKIPMAIKLTSSNSPATGSFKFEGQGYVFGANTDGDGVATATNFLLKKGSQTPSDLKTSSDYNFLWPEDTTTTNVWTSIGDINMASPVVQLQSSKGTSKLYDYVYKITPNGAWLVLAGKGDLNSASSTLLNAGTNVSGGGTNHSGFIDTLYQNTGSLWFLGTDIDDGNNNTGVGVTTRVLDFNNFTAGIPTANDVNFAALLGGVGYYAPDLQEFGLSAGSSSGVYKTAIFKVKEIDSNSGYTKTAFTIPTHTDTGLWTIYIDTENGNAGTVDTAAGGAGTKTNYNGKVVAADYNGYVSLTSLSEYTGNLSNYTKAYDDNGTKVELANRELTLTLPNSRMKAKITIESTDATYTTSAGEPLPGVKVGDTGKTPTGTTVKIDKVTATCPAGGAASTATYQKVVKVDRLVYADDEVTSGNHIIVGGYLINTLADGLVLSDDTTLNDTLTASGDKVAELLDNGDIIVAGYTADDTADAAKELIDALDALQ